MRNLKKNFVRVLPTDDHGNATVEKSHIFYFFIVIQIKKEITPKSITLWSLVLVKK
jgi:hypothetical protein